MAKASDTVKQLQRRIRQLERLRGALVRTADGPVLLDIVRVRDPFAAFELAHAGLPTLPALAATLELRGEPQHLSPALLARARRDLLAITASDGLELVHAAPRLFRSHGPFPADWSDVQAARITTLAAALHPSTGPEDWPLELVAAVHGPAAAALLADWIFRSTGLGLRRRREARRRLEALIRRIHDPTTTGHEPFAPAVSLAAAAAARLARPGRSADRRLDALLRSLLAWPAAPVPADSLKPPVPADSLGAAARAALAERVRARGEPLIHELAATRTDAHRAALRRTLTAYALAFAPDPADPPPPLGPEALEQARDRLRAATDVGLPVGLTLPRALWLLRLPIEPDVRAAVTAWVVAGFPPALLEQVVAHAQHARLAGLRGDVALATAYADWLVRLVPHYAKLGVTLVLEPAHFARLHATHRGGLALLAHCLVEHHAPGERGADGQLARLRATLGLFTARPQRAEALLADLSLAPAGLGRRHFPAFAEFLHDDPLLDRFCHLCELADEPVALSHALRRDLERVPRMLRQHDWLAAQPTRTEDQDARLAHLTAEIAASELADPAWTLRRLADRCDALQARAFARRLDAILHDTLLEAIGAAPPAWTPAWRDAVRFWLGAAERNRGLLTRLLRFAAAEPGRAIAPTLPQGQVWITTAATRFDVAAWLAPRRQTLELANHRLTIALEDDPLEVLRMGIPFDTCLSLADGFNADSTVLNAVDPNKRVVYVRDARGTVVARKLLAISKDFTLLGYRLYTADANPALAAAVHTFCRSLAADCKLALADTGTPAAIHPGFWYDDGTVAWTDAHAPLAQLADYFARRGVAPLPLSQWATRNLQAWHAWIRDDVALARQILPHLHGNPAAGAASDVIAAHLGPRDLARAARLDETLAGVHLRQVARSGVPALLHAAAAYGKFPNLLGDVADATDHAPSSAAVARAWLAATARTRRDAPHFNDHSLEHRTFQLGRHLAQLPIAELLAACASLDATWAWVLEQSPSCADCRTYARHDLHRAIEAAHARAPDPDAVIAALQGRRGRLAQDLALHLAARFSLAVRPCPLEHGLGATWVTRLLQRPVPAPRVLAVLRGLQRARPDLAHSEDMFAAVVRQAGPGAVHPHLLRPADPPFAHLGELLLHLPDLALLAPWHDHGVPPTAEHPLDRWTLHVHRRTTTAWRRRLARTSEHEEDAARRWLGLLGDVPALARLGGQVQQRIAADITAQLTRRDRPEHVPADMSEKTATTARAPLAIDLTLLHDAVAILLRTTDPAPRTRALAVLAAAELGRDAWHDLLACLVPTDAAPPADAVPLLTTMLARDELRGLDCALVARMSAAPELHPALVTRLVADAHGHHTQIHAAYSQLERAACPDPAARDALLAAFIAAAGDDTVYVDTAMNARDRDRFLACLPIWTTSPPPAWLALYRNVRDPHLQSVLLAARLAGLGPADRTALRTLADKTWDRPEDDEDEHAARTWLLTALAPP